MVRQWILIIAVLAGMRSSLPPQMPAARLVDDNDTVVLRGNVHPLAAPSTTWSHRFFPSDGADDPLPEASPAKQAALDRLIAEQHDPTSPNYHRWLSPEDSAGNSGPHR